MFTVGMATVFPAYEQPKDREPSRHSLRRSEDDGTTG